MKLSLPVLGLIVATGIPLAAFAQENNAAQHGASPELRAQMQQARDTAKTAAFNDLSPADRAKVQAVIDQINNGQLTDLRGAARQIDAILTPAESKAVLAERDKLIQTIRANMPPRPERPTPNGDAPGRPNGARRNDPGRFLIQLGVSREKLHALRRAQQGMPNEQKPQ